MSIVINDESAANTAEFAYQEIYDIFADSTKVFFKSDGGSGTATCPTGEQIVWGFRYHFSASFDSSNSCTVSNNRHCEVGATSCSFSNACRPSSADENGILLLCSRKTIPTSKAYSLATTGQVARTASCGDPNERVIWGFSYHHMNDYDTTCMKANYGICDTPLSTSCSTQQCTASDGLVMMYLLCAQGLYADAVEQFTNFKSVASDSDEYDVKCDADKPVQLTGVTLSFSETFTTEVAELATRPVQKLCDFDVDSTGTRGRCIHGFSDTDENDESFLTTMCGVSRPSVATTLAPTASPTRPPTSTPTKLPTGTPTISPTKLPTSSPNNLPTESPTHVPTISPTQEGNWTAPFPVTPTASPTYTPKITGPSQNTASNFVLYAGVAGAMVVLLLSAVVVIVRRGNKLRSIEESSNADSFLMEPNPKPDDVSDSLFPLEPDQTDSNMFSYQIVNGVPVVQGDKRDHYHYDEENTQSPRRQKVIVRPPSDASPHI